MTIDHKLMESLEYKGEYGGRVTCKDCFLFKDGSCSKLDERIKVSGSNNVCRHFKPKIQNSSSPIFNFDDYLEFLGSDYYRPWSVDTDIIIGSARIGEVQLDGGKLAELIPNSYSPLYQSYDKPWCSTNFPKCLVKVDNHNFQVEYRLYREMEFIKEHKIQFTYHYWKDKPTQRKYHSEVNDEWEIT